MSAMVSKIVELGQQGIKLREKGREAEANETLQHAQRAAYKLIESNRVAGEIATRNESIEQLEELLIAVGAIDNPVAIEIEQIIERAITTEERSMLKFAVLVKPNERAERAEKACERILRASWCHEPNPNRSKGI